MKCHNSFLNAKARCRGAEQLAVLAETGASGQFDQEEVALGYSNRLTEDVTCCDCDDEIFTIPQGSKYGIFTYIYKKEHPNVSKCRY